MLKTYQSPELIPVDPPLATRGCWNCGHCADFGPRLVCCVERDVDGCGEIYDVTMDERNSEYGNVPCTDWEEE